jgi:protein-S-isoprenylcysteine O-methyltransferase Ste14
MKTKKNLLTRSNVRDIVILCSFASSLIYNHSVTTETIGFCLLALGCFLHIVAKGILVRNVVLCNKGIYAIIRHPYYLANYLIDSSFCVLSGNPYLVAAYPFLFFWSYGPTLRTEEKFLASKYGDSFQEDSFNIPQVFPDKASLKHWRGLFEGFSVRRITLKECARITRFCSTGSAIMLVHAVRLKNLNELSYLFHPTRNDYDEFSFMLLAASFFFLSLVFMLMDRNSRGERESSYYNARPLH